MDAFIFWLTILTIMIAVPGTVLSVLDLKERWGTKKKKTPRIET